MTDDAGDDKRPGYPPIAAARQRRYSCGVSRHERAFLAAVLITAAFFGLGRVALRLSAPSDGATTQRTGIAPDGQTALIMRIFAGADTPIRAGDMIVAVNGVAITEWARQSRNVLAAPAWPHDTLLAPGSTLTYQLWRDGEQREVRATLRPFLLARIGDDIGDVISALVYLCVGAFVFMRRPHLQSARALLLLGCGVFCTNLFRAYELEATDFLHPALFGGSVALLRLTSPLVISGIAHFALTFPKPLAWVERRASLPLALHAGVIAGLFVVNGITVPALVDDPLRAYVTGWRVGNGLSIGVMALALAIGLWRFRHAASPIERRQWLVVMLGASITAIGSTALSRVPQILGQALPYVLIPLTVSEAAFPVAIMIAVLRYRLFDFDRVLVRAIVYGLLMAVIATAYVLMGVTLGQRLSPGGNALATLALTAVVVVVFQPLRDRAQRAVARWVFGQQREPYQIMSELNQRLVAQALPRDVFENAAATLATALRAPFVAITLTQRDTGAARVVATHPVNGNLDDAERADALALPLSFQGQALGELHVAPRERGERYPERDLALLRDIAASLSLAAHNALLQDELHRSRDRAVNALEDERRRLRRDLHDGLGPTLASLTLNLDAIQGWLARFRDRASDASKSAGMLDTVDMLIDETRGISANAMSDVRRAINNLRPTLLDDLGLIGALERHSERINADAGAAHAGRTPKIHIRLTSPLPALPAGVEVAAFRIVMEALTNAIRHARAASCTASIGAATQDGQPHLLIAVRDDGIGLPATAQPGVGIAAMRDRAAELGGTLSIESTPTGTCVSARLPLPFDQE